MPTKQRKPRKSRKSCKYGKLKRPVKTKSGRKRRCKKKSRGNKSRRKSRRKSRGNKSRRKSRRKHKFNFDFDSYISLSLGSNLSIQYRDDLDGYIYSLRVVDSDNEIDCMIDITPQKVDEDMSYTYMDEDDRIYDINLDFNMDENTSIEYASKFLCILFDAMIKDDRFDISKDSLVRFYVISIPDPNNRVAVNMYNSIGFEIVADEVLNKDDFVNEEDYEDYMMRLRGGIMLAKVGDIISNCSRIHTNTSIGLLSYEEMNLPPPYYDPVVDRLVNKKDMLEKLLYDSQYSCNTRLIELERYNQQLRETLTSM